MIDSLEFENRDIWKKPEEVEDSEVKIYLFFILNICLVQEKVNTLAKLDGSNNCNIPLHKRRMLQRDLPKQSMEKRKLNVRENKYESEKYITNYVLDSKGNLYLLSPQHLLTWLKQQ